MNNNHIIIIIHTALNSSLEAFIVYCVEKLNRVRHQTVCIELAIEFIVVSLYLHNCVSNIIVLSLYIEYT